MTEGVLTALLGAAAMVAVGFITFAGSRFKEKAEDRFRSIESCEKRIDMLGAELDNQRQKFAALFETNLDMQAKMAESGREIGALKARMIDYEMMRDERDALKARVADLEARDAERERVVSAALTLLEWQGGRVDRAVAALSAQVVVGYAPDLRSVIDTLIDGSAAGEALTLSVPANAVVPVVINTTAAPPPGHGAPVTPPPTEKRPYPREDGGDDDPDADAAADGGAWLD